MTQIQTTEALVHDYINIVNRAIGENREKVPYAQILSGAERVLGDKRIDVAVYKDSADLPHDHYTLAWDDGTFSVVEHGKRDTDLTWKVREEHMHNVVGDPADYIAHPWRLNLDWLKTRLSLGSYN